MMTASQHADTPSVDALRELVGVKLGPYCSHNPVSRTQVWQWCSIMGDRNPLYLDDEFRATTEFAGADVVAPPAMMQMWTMRDCNMRYATGSTEDEPFPVIRGLERQGVRGNVAVSYDLSFHRYLVGGDRVHHYKSVESISDLKQTALGRGYFFTDREEYFDQHGQLFAEALITYFQYIPHLQSRETPAAVQTAPSVAGSATGGAAEIIQCVRDRIKPGDVLPELNIPITHELVVGGAIATQDFTPVHHNVEAARAAGTADIFMNILTTTGLCARYLSDWAGPESRLSNLSLRLMAPNHPGDNMVMTGVVEGVTHEVAQQMLDVSFRGDNTLGSHVQGRAALRLPKN